VNHVAGTRDENVPVVTVLDLQQEQHQRVGGNALDEVNLRFLELRRLDAAVGL
jgi:hypothetical protein